MRKQPLRLGRVIRPMVVLSLVAGAGAVQAQTERSPYYFGVRQAFSYNDNLFKQPTGQEISDVYSTTSLLAGIDQPIGRQRFFLDGAMNFDRYQDIDYLDNEGYNISTGLDFSTIEFISGSLRYSAVRSLADYGGADAQSITTKNVQDTRVFAGNVRWGLTRRLALTGLAEHRAVKFSAPEYDDQEYSQNVFGGGIRYGLQELMTFGIGYRVTKGETSNAVTVGVVTQVDETDRRDIDLTMSWQPSALSTLNARISQTEEDHSHPGYADVDAITGALSWQYRPTAKLSFDLGLTRDTGSEILAASISGTPGNPSGQSPGYDTNRITDAARIGVAYLATSKIRANLGYNGSKTTSEGGSGINNNTRTNRYAVGLHYTATNALTFGCAYDYERQNQDAGGGSTVYKSSLTSCYGQYTLR